MSAASASARSKRLPGRGLAAAAGSECWDFAELETRAGGRAKVLRAQGLSGGQLVVVPDSPALELLVMQQAVARLGCGLFPVNGHDADGDWGRLADSAGVEWIWRPAAGGDGRLERRSPSPAQASPQVQAALLVATSGSQAEPKAVMLTPGNLRASAGLVNARLGLGAGDVWLSCLPRTHVGGLMIGHRCALAGACVLLHEGFDAEAVARDLARWRVTHLSLVPPMLGRLLALCQGPPPSLRVLLVGGQALSRALAREAVAEGWPLHVTYGMTETSSQVATSALIEAPPVTGSVGPVLPGIQVDCQGTAEAPAPIRVRGGVVMAGYANPGRRPGQGLDDGWLTTADLGYFTEGGGLVVRGRADDVLVIGGESVVPAQVEERLLAVNELDSVVVLGIPDRAWGHRLAAAYTGRLRPEELERWCRSWLPGRLRPRQLLRLERLPRLASGKPDRRRIRRMLADPHRAAAAGG
jgi:O-succinylbenzoic acid--CoA ligase